MTTGFLARAMRLVTALLTGERRLPVVAFPIRYHASRQRNAARRRLSLGLVAGLGLALSGALADDPAALPRFASLKADEVYMRAGPGQTYPVIWIYVRKGMPIEIVDESDGWREVRDIGGEKGWMHRVMLSASRTVIVTGLGMATARDRPDAESEPVFRAEPGVIGELGPCEAGWCKVTVDNVSGWMTVDTLWGVLPGDSPG